MLLLLDRDGVINFDSDDYIKCPDEWHPIPGSLEAMARFTQAGNKIVIVTNQSGVGRGLYTLETLDAIHQKLLISIKELGGYIDGIYFCPHHPNSNCSCRKPRPGMFKQIKHDFNLDNWHECLLVGDSWRDIEAAQNVGCPAAIVKTGNGLKTLSNNKIPDDVTVYANLAEVIDNLICQL